MVAIAPCVASVAATMSSPQAKLSATSAEPRLVVERIWATPGTCAHRDFGRAGDVGRHLARIALAGIDRDDDARIVDVREQA